MPMENKPEFRSGDNYFKLSDLKSLVRMIPRVIVGGKGINVRMFGDRVLVEAKAEQAPPSGGSKISLFQVVEEKDDYLICTRYVPSAEPDPEAPTVKVAKPYLLRRTPFHAQTIDYGRASIRYTYDLTSDPLEIGTRLAKVMSINNADDNVEETDVNTEEDQMISPPYYAGEILTAFQGDTGVLDEEGNSLSWADLNTGARCWTHNSRHDPDNPNDP